MDGGDWWEVATADLVSSTKVKKPLVLSDTTFLYWVITGHSENTGLVQSLCA